MNIAEFSIRNKVLCAIAIIVTLLAGWNAFKNMVRLEDPEFIIRQAQVITYYPGATPKQVAEEVTDPLETAIQQLAEVKEITSVSSNGKSEISVEIKYEASKSKNQLQTVWTKLRNKVNDARRSLPPGASDSIVADDFGDLFGMYYFVTGEDYSIAQLRTYAKSFRDELLQVPGIARVQLAGESSPAIYVAFSREKMQALGVSVSQIYQSLQQRNIVVDAGNTRVGDLRMSITPTGGIDSIQDLNNTLISTSDKGNLIHLSDIATVTHGEKQPDSTIMYFNGKRAIAIGVSAVSGENVVKLGKRVEAKVAESVSARPLGMQVEQFYQQGQEVEASINNFVENVIAALAIVVITLLIFMGMRPAIVIGAILLLTIAATLAVMNISGIPMHRISLGALIIALGMMVDNAIVVTEGMLIGINKGENKLAVAKRIIKQTIWPLLGGTLVGCVAFAPIGFAPGSTAEFTGSLFWVIFISLIFSWVFAITLTPLFCHDLFKQPKTASGEYTDSALSVKYKAFVRNAIQHRWKVISLTVALFVASVYGFNFVKSGFFPASTTPQIVVDFWMPEGTDIKTTQDRMKKLETYLQKLEHVNTVETSVGAGGLRYMLVYPPQSPNSSYGQALVIVDDYKNIDAMLGKIQQHIDNEFPAAQAKVWRFQLGPVGGSKIQVEFSGPNPSVLRDLADQAKAIMHHDGGAISIKDNWRQQVAAIEPIFNEAKARQAGVTRQDIAQALKQTYSGRDIGVYRDGNTLVPIIAIAPHDEQVDLADIGQVQVLSSSGAVVSLDSVVSGFKTVWRDNLMRRENRSWMIKAEADPLPGELASDLRNRLVPQMDKIQLPNGYKMEWGGEYKDSKDSQDDLASTLPLGLGTMVIIVFLLFGTVKQPVLIWCVVPLALIGVVVGLLSTGIPMEFMGILGLLSLSGLLVKNAIVLVDQIDLEIKEGKPRLDAIVDAATSRVRPVTMGALTTVLGIIPLFFDAFFKSMSVVLGFGLTFATLLTLIVMPVLYSVFFKVGNDERKTAM
ncbi:efflux RND transporter permease subunit [Parashewanella spongiae]|uniref:Efflux RND transporter permease subunit n=1 Tax=Parashewanella spongiae TaxID=342950 RepID=A0A3A6TM68_9GAMM|nr:efflux RND transporter permease subunit [Parashewanella spongiae]MCL1080034.1 efflux RND transporter permease subunit [Parashewanella spongiae]RJY05838.1 efflux RND transporter permease subunit [Parashewanella spongiae]